MAWIRQAPSGRWRAEYRDPAKRKRSRTFPRKADAARWLADQQTRMARGEWLDPALGRMTFSEFWPKFIEASAHLRPATRDLYERLAARYVLPYFGERRLARISPLDVRAFVADTASKVGPATVNASYRLLRRVLNAAIDAGVIGRNPCHGTKAPPPGTDEMRFLSAEEVKRLAEATPERYQTLIYVLAYAGLRIGEAAALRVDDLDLLRGRIGIERSVSEVRGRLLVGPTKTGTRRTVSIPPFLRQMLAAHLAAYPTTEGFVFAAPQGGQLRPQNFRRRVFAKAVRAAGLEPLRVHDLRHTCAALLIGSGAHVKEIAERLGHSSPAVTMKTYAHVLPSLEARLAEALEVTYRQASVGSFAAYLPPERRPEVVRLSAREAENPL